MTLKMMTSQQQAERLTALPRRPGEVWQGGLVRLPAWVMEPAGRPMRSAAPLWVSLKTEIAHVGSAARLEALDWRDALTALVDFACDTRRAGYRPGKLEVNDAALAKNLAEALGDSDIEISHRDSLLAVNRIVQEMTESMSGRPMLPGPLDVPGMTLERLRSFAEAAGAFYLAAPWRHLEDVDLLRIETNVPDPGLRYAMALGAAGDTFGLGLVESEDDLWAIYRSEPGRAALPRGGLWQVAFDPIQEMPLPDSDLWLDHDLPVAGERAYPYAIQMRPGGRLRRATPRILSFLESLLRALADSEEAEIDQGRWSKDVVTPDGRASVTLSLPYLLDPPDPRTAMSRGVIPDHRAMERGIWRIDRHLAAHPAADVKELRETLERSRGVPIQEIEFKPAGVHDEAQDLCYEAYDALGRRQLQLARRALAVCPDCADAHVILAERESDPQQALHHYERGVEAGERSLGRELFEEEAGHFWGIIRTRPYMRALYGLASTLEDLTRIDDAVDRYRTMLRLNPADDQGARYRLLPLLIEAGWDDDAAALMRRYQRERSPEWAYARALLAFRRYGDKARSRTALARAVKINPFVPEYLIDDEDATAAPRTSELWDPTHRLAQAAICAELLGAAWEATHGAIEWLKGRTRTP